MDKRFFFFYLVAITWSIISVLCKELEGLARFDSQRQCLNPVESIQFFFEIHFQIGVRYAVQRKRIPCSPKRPDQLCGRQIFC